MRTGLAALCAAMLLAGCAGNGAVQQQAPTEGPTLENGTVVGEAGDPRNRARLHTELASLYYARGNNAVALEELRVATAADPTYATAHMMFGVVYQELREVKLAEQSFERAQRLAPGDPNVNHAHGWFLCQTQREKESIPYFLTAIRNPLYQTPWRSYSAAGLCTLHTGDAKSAEELFQRALRLEPDEPIATLQMGRIRYGQGKLDEARRLVSRFNKLAEPTAESLWLALRIERRAGARVSEASYATQLRRRFPNSAEYQALQRGTFD
jgi:type IV pilus assembly protein PilF